MKNTAWPCIKRTQRGKRLRLQHNLATITAITTLTRITVTQTSLRSLYLGNTLNTTQYKVGQCMMPLVTSLGKSVYLLYVQGLGNC